MPSRRATSPSRPATAAANFSTSAPALAAKDALIAGGVQARLAAVDLASAQNVKVSVKDGAVVLRGKAPSEQERGAYGLAAEKVPGVKAVENNVAIDPRAKTQSTGDFALAAHVTAALAAQTGVNALSVKVAADNGKVTLAGSVPASVKDTMLQTARSIKGVSTVVDDLTVK